LQDLTFDMSGNRDTVVNGWTAVPRSQGKLLAELTNPEPIKISLSDIPVPDSAVAKKTLEYAKSELPEKTFNHSMRVWYYGRSFLLPNNGNHPATICTRETFVGVSTCVFSFNRPG
jgi:hypothetical protein